MSNVPDWVDRTQSGTVYLIHLEQPLNYMTWSGKRVHGQHYLGWTKDLKRRIKEHRAGKKAASRFLAEAKRQGISWKVVRTWENATQYDEWKLKAWKHHACLCPNCKIEARARKKKAA